MARGFAVIVATLGFALALPAAAADTGRVHPGKALAYDVGKGNCLACHAMPTMPDAEQPGNAGPPLIAMSARFNSKSELRAKIWDASLDKPDTFMPLYGKHRVLSEGEIDLIADFVYGL